MQIWEEFRCNLIKICNKIKNYSNKKFQIIMKIMMKI